MTFRKKMKSFERNDKLTSLSKALRRNMTPEEKHLWYDFLRKMPFRFRRQEIIGNYIADFYCHRAKVVVELDGTQHYTAEGLAADQMRTDYMETVGIFVLRFTNAQIQENFRGVCAEIERVVSGRV